MLFATIEHSGGTGVITIAQWNTHPLEHLESRPAGCHLYGHLTDELMPLVLEVAAREPVFTTDRPRDQIVESWRRRGKDLEALDRQFKNHDSLIALGAYVIALGGRPREPSGAMS